MSLLNIIWIIVVIVFAIWMLLSERSNWETVYEASGNKVKEAQERYNYLQEKGIHCRLKNYTPGTYRMMGLGGVQNRAPSSVLLQVRKKKKPIKLTNILLILTINIPSPQKDNRIVHLNKRTSFKNNRMGGDKT